MKWPDNTDPENSRVSGPVCGQDPRCVLVILLVIVFDSSVLVCLFIVCLGFGGGGFFGGQSLDLTKLLCLCKNVVSAKLALKIA